MKISLYLLILLGIIHSTFTFFFFDKINADAIWFFGSGLTYVFMGLYNLAAIRVKVRSISIMAVVLNFLGTVFTIAIAYILKEPQAFLALILVILIFLSSIKNIK